MYEFGYFHLLSLEIMNCIAIFGMCLFILTPKKDRKTVFFSVLLWGVLLSIISSAVQSINSDTEYYPYAFTLAMFIPIMLLFKEDIPVKLYVFSSAVMFNVLFNGLSATLMSIWLSENTDPVVATTSFLILRSILMFVMLGMSFYMLRPLLSSLFSRVRSDTWYCFSLFPIIVIMALILAFVPTTTIPLRSSNEMAFLFWAVIIGLAYYFLSRYVTISMEKFQTKQELEYANKLLHMERTYFTMLNENLNKMRILKHDFRHHISVLYQLNSMDDNEEIKKYLDNMNLNIAASDVLPLCANETLNIILSHYISRAKDEGIVLDVKIQVPKNLAFDATDLTIVLGNSIENALRAVHEANRTVEMRINLACRFIESKLIIVVTNPYTTKIKTDSIGDIISTKKDGGLGLKSIRVIADKYNGDVNVHYDDKIFSVYVTMIEPFKPYNKMNDDVEIGLTGKDL